MNNIKKVLLLLTMFLLVGNVFSLEENTFVTIDEMYTPMGFNIEETTLYGMGYDYTGANKWTDESGYELINANFKPQSYSTNGYIVGEHNATAGYIAPDGSVVEIGNLRRFKIALKLYMRLS